MISSEANNTSGLPNAIRRYISLLIEDLRLGMTEKLTRILSAIAFCTLILFLGLIALVFITIAVSLLLTPVLSPVLSFMIISAVYLIGIAVIVIFKTQLIVNPIARFLSSLIVEPPVDPKGNDKSTPIS